MTVNEDGKSLALDLGPMMGSSVFLVYSFRMFCQSRF